MRRTDSSSAEEYVIIYRAYITLRNGRRIYARTYGLKAFALKVRKRKAG